MAGTLKNDNNGGGALFGLFAEENAFDRRTLWRIGTWGAAAVGAVIAAVTANQSSLGWRRDRLAAADLARQGQEIESLTRASENEARRLSSAIDTLNTDRDRLYARVTVLEQGLDSVTGTIAKQNSVASAPAPQPPKPAAPAAAAAAPALTTPAPAVDPSQSSFNQAAAALATGPMTAPPAAAAATAASTGPMAMALPAERARIERPRPEAAKSEPAAAAPQSSPPPPPAPQPVASAPAGSPAAPTASTPLMAPRSIMAPPDPAASKLIELPKLADARPRAESMPETTSASSATTRESSSNADHGKEKTADKSKKETTETESKQTMAAAPDNVAVRHTDFAVDLGGANSIGGLRALWRGLVKSNAELAELRPIIVIRESNTGLGMQLHLAAGPLKDAAAAAKICAGLTEAERSCETTVFDGQRLVTSADEAPSPSTAKPAQARPGYSYRRGSPRHSRSEEAPPKPEPEPPASTFSALFGGKR